MGGRGAMVAAKLCDSCKSATATLFCRADSAFLCVSCDSKIHSANKLASRHARVWVCEVCEHAPASVTCKADAAHLCVTCDRDIHSANPLARRHERVPINPFFELNGDGGTAEAAGTAGSLKLNANATINKLFGEDCYSDLDAEEAEAASWLLTDSNGNQNANGCGKVMERGDPKSIDHLFAGDIDPYLVLDLSAEPKEDRNGSAADCVVPDQKIKHRQHHQNSYYNLASCNSQFDDAYENSASKPYNANQPALSQSVSSSSLDVGVVPDANAMADVSKSTVGAVAAVSVFDREARVLRYREKRKNRKFEKTIRYASRKAYAETRPRIKGRFAKRTEVQVGRVEDVNDGVFGSSPQQLMQDTGYCVVPSF